MKPKVIDWASQKLFSYLHQSNLVYNTCWEDPRLDRAALDLSPSDNVLVITSAGCNALDYALEAPNHVYAVDMNPRQNALLDLKIAAIRAFDYDTFFQLFGKGRIDNFADLYKAHLRPQLNDSARQHWDNHLDYFGGSRIRPTLYFRGTSGVFARLMNYYIDFSRLRQDIAALFSASSLDEQHHIYHDHLKSQLWSQAIKSLFSYDATLSLLGVPRPQRKQVEGTYPGGIVKFMEDCVEAVFTKLSLHDNYFWWLYFMGEYSPDRCPEYLKEENFLQLKAGLVDRISTHTNTIHEFLEDHDRPISRFVLLDHMDWLSSMNHPTLVREWQAIVDKATSEARVIWRSGGLSVDFIDPIEVKVRGRRSMMSEHLIYNKPLAAELHAKDRVHTYGSFYIADLDVH
jgi:S-adenosylmethionine-diacylglycerol 3-amino-3-carboxypropyl transferase